MTLFITFLTKMGCWLVSLSTKNLPVFPYFALRLSVVERGRKSQLIVMSKHGCLKNISQTLCRKLYKSTQSRLKEKKERTFFQH